jgi:signal transduction histidine kinase
MRSLVIRLSLFFMPCAKTALLAPTPLLSGLRTSLKIFLMLILILVALIPSPPCWADNGVPDANESVVTVPFDPDHDAAFMPGLALQVFEDPHGQMTIQQVRMETGWLPSDAITPNKGFTSSAWWFRFRIRLAPARDSAWLLINDALLNRIDIWTDAPGSTMTHQRGGGWTPVSQRELKHRTHLYPLPRGAAAPVDVYVRVESKLAVVVPLWIVSGVQLTQRIDQEALFHGGYFASMIVVVIFNLAYAWRLRSGANFYFGLFAASLVFFYTVFLGYSFKYFWGDLPWLDNYLIGFATLCAAIFGSLFTRRFVSEQVLPLEAFQNRIVGCGVVAWLIVLMLQRPDLSIQVASLVALMACFSVVFIVYMSIRHGKSEGWLVIVAFSVMFIGILMTLLRGFGVLESNLFTEHSLQIGSLSQCILVMTAFIERSRRMQQEIVESQEKHLQVLEHQVRERTAELVNAQQKLIASEKMAALGVFTAGMAHEINNPANFVSVGAQNAAAQIAGLRSFVNDLLADDPDPDITQEFDSWFKRLESSNTTVSEGISRIERVVKRLRTDHPEGDVGMQPADVVESLESAWRVLSPTVKTSIVLTEQFDARPQASCMIADIHQVFLALLSNAVHAIEDAVSAKGEGYQGTIRLESREEAGNVVITVADNGVGIPEDKIDKVFDPFFTTKVVGRGAGLGLSMARDVVKKHGGSLEVHSVPGDGSTFTLALPVAQEKG